MAKPDLRKVLDHDIEEIWAFLEKRGVLRILADSGSVRLLMQTGSYVEVTPKGLEALLAQDRARLQQEAKAASGRRAFLGYRTSFSNLGHGQIVPTSGPEPHYGIVGRDKKRIDEINNEWRTLIRWKVDVQKLLNFVAAGEIEIPAGFLPPTKKTLRKTSDDFDKIAEAFVAVCEHAKTFRPSLQQLSEHSGISAKTIDRKLKTAETLIRLKRLVQKKINYTKPANQDRKHFWFDVEQEVNAMAESLSTRRKAQRERSSDRMDRFANNEDESE
jgi:hypothetical protein